MVDNMRMRKIIPVPGWASNFCTKGAGKLTPLLTMPVRLVGTRACLRPCLRPFALQFVLQAVKLKAEGRSDISPKLVPGASNRHRLAFLFHGTLRTGFWPWVSYTSSADLSSRKPCGTCEARWPRLTGTSVPYTRVNVKWFGLGSGFLPSPAPNKERGFYP